eukprot:711196_1
MSQTECPVIIDNGSGFIKAGFSPNKTPAAIVPALVGQWAGGYRPVSTCKYVTISQKEWYIGQDAINNIGRLRIRPSIEQGIVVNWDFMEKIWHHTFYNELRVAPEEHPVLMTEAPLNPKANREKMTQIMFETFDVPQFYVSIAAVLSLYASGRMTGIVLDSGYDVTHAVPICEGYALPHAIQRADFGGGNVNEHLMKLLKEKGHNVPYFQYQREEVTKMKHNLCSVVMDLDQELEHLETVEYELPDGNTITFGSERVQITERLFGTDFYHVKYAYHRTGVHGMLLNHCYHDMNCRGGDCSHDTYEESRGVHGMVFYSVMKCDEDIREKLFQNIVLSGGNTMFDGFKERLLKELYGILGPVNEIAINGYLRLLNKNKAMHSDIVELVYKYALYRYNVIDVDRDIPDIHANFRDCIKRIHGSIDVGINLDITNNYENLHNDATTETNKQILSWIGGSIVSSLSTFNEMWITKDEYDELGVSIVHRKCT